MKSNFYKFDVDELIKLYKEKIREQKFKDEQDMNTSNKALYETVLFEMESSDKYVDEKKKSHNKEFFLNLDVLLNNLIKEHGITNGFLVCSADAPSASVYVNHFEKGAMTDLSKALKKRLGKKFAKKLRLLAKSNKANENAVTTAKATAVGRSALVLIIDGKLHLGKFDDVIYAEFDYQPNHSFTVALFSENGATMSETNKN